MHKDEIGTLNPIFSGLVARKRSDAKQTFPVIGVNERGKYVIAVSNGAHVLPENEFDIVVRDWSRADNNSSLAGL